MLKVLLILLALLNAVPAQAALKWQYRSTSNSQSYYASALRSMNVLRTSTPWSLAAGGASVFGGTFLQVSAGSQQTLFPALDNINIGTTAYTILMRLVPRATGNPASNAGIMQIGQTFSAVVGPAQGIAISILSANSKVQISGGNRTNGFAYFNDLQFATAPSFTAGVATDLWIVWDGTTTAGHVELWQGINGLAPTKISTATASAVMQAPVLGIATEISIGYTQADGAINQGFDYNELAVFDTAFDPSAVYGARSDFIPSSAYEGYNFTSLAAGSVANGTAYGPGPGTQTGTLVSPATTDVRLGTTFGAASGLTGTLAVPTASQVLSGVAIDATTGNVVQASIADVRKNTLYGPSSSLTGLVNVPGANNVLAGVPVDQTVGAYIGPAISDVRAGVVFDNGSIGTLDLPAVSVVESGIVFDNATQVGTLLSTDPGVGNVQKGIQYVINNSNFTGTLLAVTNYLKAAILRTDYGGAAPFQLTTTQGDTPTFQFQAQNGSGQSINLTGASLQTQIKGMLGAVVTIPNSQHVVAVNQSGADRGKFVVSLSSGDTQALDATSYKEIVTRAVQGSSIVYMHGQGILTVLPSEPTQ